MRSRTDLHIAGGDTEDQRAAARLLLQRFLRALAEHREFKLAHRALHAKQQPIVGMARIVVPSSSTMSVPTNPQNSISVSEIYRERVRRVCRVCG